MFGYTASPSSRFALGLSSRRGGDRATSDVCNDSTFFYILFCSLCIKTDCLVPLQVTFADIKIDWKSCTTDEHVDQYRVRKDVSFCVLALS